MQRSTSPELLLSTVSVDADAGWRVGTKSIPWLQCGILGVLPVASMLAGSCSF